MLRSVKFNTQRRLILFLLMVLAAVCLTAAACAEPIIQERAANDGSYVRWSIECENETRSVACNADDTCSMEITVLPWTTWKISANYFSVSEGELTGIIPVDGNCIWSGSNEKDFFVDDYGYVYVQGTSGSHEVVSHYVDSDGHAYTARITFHIENVSVTQSDAMRCVMLSRLAEDPYGCLSDYTSIDRYLSDMNIGINAGKSPLLKKGSTYQNGARLDHAIFASLNGGTIVKVEEDRLFDFKAVAVTWGGTTYIAFLADSAEVGYRMEIRGEAAVDFYRSLGCDSETTVVTGNSSGGALAAYVSAKTGCRTFGFDTAGKTSFLHAIFENPYEVAAHYSGDNATLYPKSLDQATFFNPFYNQLTLYPGVAEHEGFTRDLEFCGTAGSDVLSMTETEKEIRMQRVFLGDGDDYLFTTNDAVKTFIDRYNIICGSAGTINKYIEEFLEHKNILKAALKNFAITVGTEIVLSSPHVIAGGKGNDFLVGSIRNDHYVYSHGDGKDIIYDFGGSDAIYLLDCVNVRIEEKPFSINVISDGETIIEIRANGVGKGNLKVYTGTPDNAYFLKEFKREKNDFMESAFTILHYLGIGCPVDVRILDENGNTAVLLEDGVESSFEEEFGFFSVVYDGDEYQKSILLMDPSYQVVIEGVGDGTMDYSSLLYDFESEDSTEIHFENIPVASGAVYYPVFDDENVIMQVDLDGDGTMDGTVVNDRSIELDQSKAELNLGETLTLKATVTPAGTPLVWETTDETIVTVDENGNITAVGFGEALVGAMLTDGSRKMAYCRIVVPEEQITAADFTITGLEDSYPYTGEAVEPELTVSYHGLSLVAEQDYDLSYSNQYEAGTASVTLTGLGRFSGSVTLTYQITAAADTVEQKVAALAAQCRAQGFSSEYEKALWLHDWLTANADYDFTYTYYGADGVLLWGTGVCQSYSSAYQLLLNELGIENHVIISPEMDHSWNLVKIDGEWCHVDCTWDDPAGGSMENHSYFGLSDALMRRDHTWDASQYPAANSLNNHYYKREGALCADEKAGIMACMDQAAQQQLASFEVCYCGSDPAFLIQDVFEEWYHTNNWKYGLRSYTVKVSGFFLSISIEYTDPWDQPAELTKPVACPAFVLSGPAGSYKSSNYQNNGLVLVFGREGCLNTQGLMDRLHSELPLLRESGVDVIVSLEGAGSLEDLKNLLDLYPNFRYAYDGTPVMYSLVEAVGYTDGWLTYPLVFIINQDQQIVYYSTGYVSNIDMLMGEAFETATGHALPAPSKDPYVNTQDGDLKELTGNAVIQQLYQISLQSRQTIFQFEYSPDNYTSARQLESFEQNAALFDRLGISMAACYESVTEEQLSSLRTQYPHITFMSADGTDVMWMMLRAVNYPLSQPAYYLSNYLIDSRGHIVDYLNGSVYSMAEITGRFADTFVMNGRLPSQTVRIPQDAFSGCAYPSFDLSTARLKYIDSGAFRNCKALELVKIPSSVIRIAPDAFGGCENLIILCEYKSYAHEYAEEHDLEYVLY